MTDEQQQDELLDLSEPIVINIKKKKKRKYSRGFRDLQTVGRRMTKVSSRMARAVSKGVSSYRKASDKSSRKKRDGALRDFNVNVAKSFSRSLRESSRIPADIAKGLSTRGTRKAMRRQIRGAARLIRVLGFR